MNRPSEDYWWGQRVDDAMFAAQQQAATDDLATHDVWTREPCGCDATDSHDAGQEIHHGPERDADLRDEEAAQAAVELGWGGVA